MREPANIAGLAVVSNRNPRRFDCARRAELRAIAPSTRQWRVPV